MKTVTYRNIDFELFALFLVLTSLLIFISRILLIENHLLLFIKDCLGNIGGVLTATFLFIWYKFSNGDVADLKSRIIIAFAVATGLIIYEFIQLWLPWMVFDVRDIYGTIIGFVITLPLNFIISRHTTIRKSREC